MSYQKDAASFPPVWELLSLPSNQGERVQIHYWEAIVFHAEFPKSNGVVFNGNGRSAEANGDGQTMVAGVSEGALPDIENHANRLLGLLNELRSFADDACDAVLREAECADRMEETMETEINGLRDQIREKRGIPSGTRNNSRAI